MPLNVLIAIDKFKGTFTSVEIASLIEKKIKSEINCTTSIIPVSDGGQGFLESILFAKNLRQIKLSTVNAVFEPIETICLVDNDTCYIESSKIIGIDILTKEKQNPCHTSSFGLGLVIKQIIERGYKEIIVGLGGSATNDAGIGMADALGAVFTDNKGNRLEPIGQNLVKVKKINLDILKKTTSNIEFTALCDVQNPLFGNKGAANCFAAQKGANINQVKMLDKGLRNIYKFSNFKNNIVSQIFFGSAGGLGFGFNFFLNANLFSGAEKIIQILQIEKKISECDVLITGEGKFDEQSMNGKITGKLIDLALKNNKSIIVLCGILEKTINNKNIRIVNLFDKDIDEKFVKEQTPLKIKQIELNISK